jgi:hypothetical protein
MGRRGPKPMNSRVRELKGYPPRLLLNRPHPPATVPDVRWIDSEESPFGWLERHSSFEPVSGRRRRTRPAKSEK